MPSWTWCFRCLNKIVIHCCIWVVGITGSYLLGSMLVSLMGCPDWEFSWISLYLKLRASCSPFLVSWNFLYSWKIIVIWTKKQHIRFCSMLVKESTTELFKVAVFWVVAPCSLVEVYQRFRGPSCLYHQGESPWWWRQQGPLKRW
jgi:hypothetical protein